MSSEPVPPQDTAVELMRAMTRLRARLRTEAPIDDLPWNWSHLTTLYRIVTDGPMSVSELAQAEHVRRQSMAETVTALRDGALVTTAKDPNDGRKSLVSATPAGRALTERIPAAREAWLAGVIGTALRAPERRTLDKAAEIMNRLADSETP
ncbi:MULTISPECIES: MarR family winged helix-turn-helix transcriptional regulator [unclassified Streptomyces]|uniref:MarR family winged helix-turn-helix transcriptional regulator n=1 Tax=unclassified Streptomyces TaxID=2593676 RepID=UPI002E12EE7D|nr:MarR family transcriptional regulator [Streptomyces sp. NBC_01236]